MGFVVPPPKGSKFLFGVGSKAWDELQSRKRELTPKELTKMKSRLKKKYNDTDRLFNSAWREVLYFARNSEIRDFEELCAIYEQITSQKVNNPRSSFYIYGR